jgi:hypothetical protein
LYTPVNPSYTGDQDQEDFSSRAAQAKKSKKLDLNRKKLDVLAYTCHPSYGRKYKIGESQSRLAWAKKAIPYLQNN